MISEDSATQVLVSSAREKLMAGQDLSEEELLALSGIPLSEVPELARLAHEVRLNFAGEAVELEGILSYKTGGCPEDCHFCSQSSRHSSPVKPTALLSDEEVLEAAREVAQLGATEFCLVLAVRGPNEAIMRHLERVVPLVKNETGLNVAVSAGILSKEQAFRLKEAGVHRYNHNLETARSFFPEIVTTHSFEERYQTCLYVKEAGMELCCGLIFGMGESQSQRVEALCQIRSLNPEEVPINFLNPRPGTPLEHRPLLDPWEAIKWIAISRLAMPSTILRFAGGREVTLKELQEMGMKAGINALILGNYLTTLGRPAEADLEMLKRLKMPVARLGKLL